MFNITVSLQDEFDDVGDVIQEVYWKKHQVSIYGLELFKANVLPEQAGNYQFSDETYLYPGTTVASEWPSRLDVDKRLVHIIVRPTSRQVTNTHRAVTPPSPQTEFDQFIQKFNDTQLRFVRYVQSKKTTSSSAAQPKNFRAQQAGPDYVNIGHPSENVWLPIVLYHPVFGRFLTRLRSTDPIDPKVYLRTREHFPVSQNLYEEGTKNGQARDEVTRSSFRRLLGDTLRKTKANGVEADAVITGPGATCVAIMEMKNEIGMESSDPSTQAAQSYTRYWSDDMARHWLNWCCCPSILIDIAGPWMCVLGAIFLDRPVIQPLAHFLWVSEDPARPPELGYIARVFDCISQARDELEDYYRSSNPPPLGKNTARPFPCITHYLDSTGQVVHFAYRKSLCPNNPEKAIFLAETIDKENPKPIVVKFVQSYNADAHRLLAENKLAPELLYDGTMYPQDQPGPEHYMIIMEFVQGVDLEWSRSRLSRSAFNDVKAAIDLLHSHDWVFGDLRRPNVMVLQDSTGKATGRAMLIDFDWCGKDIEGRYPLKMNMTLEWPEDVGVGAVMKKQHDLYMLNQLDPN
ncbi:kinase domain protein, putative [Rhizoctonia solani AG-3 Rhs1AP]|uniref:Kinase domain protein, putative n=1 Tax=Rhizoctonia solani AG-3 Rhs1AP TaxID=1086054 RepID=X8JSN2_9AGAM|nr:kinase domain protein, putative [Rhizoctonia solani AG-3 Rhs1AP]